MTAPATDTGAVHSWATPVRLSTHSGWKTPAPSAASPAVSPPVKWKKLIVAEISVGPRHGENCIGHSSPPYALGADETGTLAGHVIPPSSEARKRTEYESPSVLPRRSYHVTATTPSLFTATAGFRWSTRRAESARSSLTPRGFDQVFPLSLEYASRTSARPERTSGQTT